MAESNVTVGDPVLDRARKLVALDRALMEIGQPGVLERSPNELASLETRLFGPPLPGAGAPAASRAAGDAHDQAAAAAGGVDGLPPGAPEAGGAATTAKPALRLLQGPPGVAPSVDHGKRQALRSQLRVIQGGRQAL